MFVGESGVGGLHWQRCRVGCWVGNGGDRRGRLNNGGLRAGGPEGEQCWMIGDSQEKQRRSKDGSSD